MKPEYSVEVQPLMMLKLNNIPEERFVWRKTRALGMPYVWLEEELVHKFQVPADTHLELLLVDAKTATLVNNFRVRLADNYTSMNPVVRGKRQAKPALLEISDVLEKYGEHPYTATLRRLNMPAPIVRTKPSSASGNYRPPRNTADKQLEDDEDTENKRRIAPAIRLS